MFNNKTKLVEKERNNIIATKQKNICFFQRYFL